MPRRKRRVVPIAKGIQLYSQLTKTTAKKPCFSKSGDAAPIGARLDVWFLEPDFNLS